MALSTTFTQLMHPETTKFGKITKIRPFHRSRSFKVTDFDTNRKLMINTNLPPILHRLRDIAFEMSQIAIFGYPSCV